MEAKIEYRMFVVGCAHKWHKTEIRSLFVAKRETGTVCISEYGEARAKARAREIMGGRDGVLSQRLQAEVNELAASRKTKNPGWLVLLHVARARIAKDRLAFLVESSCAITK